jgi:PAS domain S-box-containing protein
MSYVLLVDDHDENLALLRASFEGNGLPHACASHGAEALELARRSAPVAVVADLLMPVMDGYTLLRQWKSDPVLRLIPFIVYTATYTDPEDEQLAMDLGADAFVCKFGEPSGLVTRVRELISGAAAAPRAQPRRPIVPEEAHLSTYNARLVRKLEAKTLQLHATNRALLEEIAKRREIASTQVAVLNTLTAHVALIDAFGRITAVNEAWRGFADSNGLRTADFAVGENYLKFCDQAIGINSLEAKHAATGIRAVLAGELKLFEIEYPCHSPTESRWFRLQVNPLHDAKLAGAVIKHIEVTEQREVELKFVQSEAQYLLLLNSTAEGIYRLDMNGVCTFCNPTAARLLGYADPREIIGQSAHAHHHHSRLDGSLYPVAECQAHLPLRSGQGTHSDNEAFFRADGSRFPVEYWSYPILSGPDIAGTVVTFLDITLRRDLESQFLQSQKMEAVGRLAGGVAHDFNNALQVILSNAELLEERMSSDAAGTELNREILSAGRRAASLTRQLLALSRKQLLRPSVLDLNALMANIETLLRRMIGENITLTIHPSPTLGMIEADRAQIEQVLINLAINSRDAMPSGGGLLITSSTLKCDNTVTPPRPFIEAAEYAVLSIRDTGVGMDESTLARAFEPFFTTKEPGKGTGLGLSTVYGIMKQSNGYVLVDSAPGKGSEFRLYFPVVEGTPEVIYSDAPHNPPLQGRETVLLVEDEHSLRAVIGNMLKANGYAVLDAQDGTAAIELAEHFAAPIDLLLTDVILPGISGRNIADQLRVSRPSMKVIYMSGYTDDLIAQTGVIDTNTILLEKPFPISLLLQRIRETFDARPALSSPPN